MNGNKFMNKKEIFTRRMLLLFIILVLGLAKVVGITTPATASPGLIVEALSSTLTPEGLANQLVGEGIAISSVTYTGANVAAGRFSGGIGIIGFESGLILSSGSLENVVGPNVLDNITTNNFAPGDPDLDNLLSEGLITNDAAILEFDFVPQDNIVSFQYVFASDEYNEYVDSIYNDIFAFFINGVNCATINGIPVSVNTINNGNPFGIVPGSNPELYLNNDLNDGGGSIDTEMDGLTVILTCVASVTAGATNHIKLTIADTSDFILDTNVFLKSGSFSSGPPTAIELIWFAAEVNAESVTLAWETASEINNEGFNIWRSEMAEGPYTKLNPELIPALGNANTGAIYVYTDTAVVKGKTYYYKLEDIDTFGGSTFHEPALQVILTQVNQVIYLPLIFK